MPLPVRSVGPLKPAAIQNAWLPSQTEPWPDQCLPCCHCNHHVIVQNRILRDHPWVALELFKAFQRSKEVAYERARAQQFTYLYFPGRDFQAQAEVVGDDPYSIGIRAMGKNIERAIQGSVQQGLLQHPLRLEDVYFHTTLDT